MFTNSRRLWKAFIFRKKDGHQQATLLGSFVGSSLMEGFLADSWRFYFDNEEFIKTDIADFQVYETVFCMHLLDRIAFARLTSRQAFLNAMLSTVAPYLVRADLLQDDTEGTEYLVELCNTKQLAWGRFSLNSEKGMPPKGWLFWEAAHDITGSHNATFLARYLNRLVVFFEIATKLIDLGTAQFNEDKRRRKRNRTDADEDKTSCEIFAIGLAGQIFGDCVKFQNEVPEGVPFDPLEFFIEGVVLHAHLLSRICPKISPKSSRPILNAISAHTLGNLEHYNVRKRPDFNFRLSLLSVERQRQYLDCKWISAFITADFPEPTIFSIAAANIFEKPDLRNKCATLHKQRAQQTYAELVELIYELNQR